MALGHQLEWVYSIEKECGSAKIMGLYILVYYFLLCLSRIREYKNSSSPSVHPSVLNLFVHDDWVDFLHIEYNDQPLIHVK